MKATDFHALSQQKFLFRAVAFLSTKRILLAATIFVVAGLTVGLVDKSLSALTHTVPLLIFVGTLAALGSLRWAITDLAVTIEHIQSAFTNAENLDKAVTDTLNRFPRKLFSFLLGLGTALLLFRIINSGLPRLSNIFLGVLCFIAGQIFAFGLLGFIWSYQLIWRLRCEPIVLFFSFHLRSLSSYSCTLGLIGIVPIMISWMFYVSGAKILWFVIVQFVIVALAWLFSEMAFSRIVLNARSEALNVVAQRTKLLWDTLPQANAETSEEVFKQVEGLEKLRQSILTYRASVVDWNSFCGKILIPIIVGVVIGACIGMTQQNTKNEPTQSKQSANIKNDLENELRK